MNQPRLRIAPSPTGEIHVGTARTALFNYLYARHIGGTFLMRIEDTDIVRSRREHADVFCDVLQWMGLSWDEDVVYQSDRFDLYKKAIDTLLENGQAYECFETPEELEAINKERATRKLPPGYDGRSRRLTEKEKQAYRDEGRPRTVRFITPDKGTSSFDDAIRGTVSVQWESVSDFVIERGNGTPTFFLANAVDDDEMGITHVVRGEDLIDSTHRILAIRRALGNSEQLFYAHTPMILAPDKSKLSKRHGAVSVENYRDAGYLPEALVNYLALLGWAPSDGREVITMDEMIAEFDITKVNHSGAVFDVKKLEWMNGEYIRAMDRTDLEDRLRPLVQGRVGDAFDEKVFSSATALAQPRATTLVSMSEQMSSLFDETFTMSPEAREQLKESPEARSILEAIYRHIEKCEWSPDGIDLREAINELGLKPRKALPVAYLAIEGSSSGLPLFDAIHLLGREESLRRLLTARDVLVD
jgi:glutamyl-tRNA synthetase